MIYENGVPPEVVERELRIAESVSKSLYEVNRKRGGIVDVVYRIAQIFGLLNAVRNMLRVLGLERFARKMMEK